MLKHELQPPLPAFAEWVREYSEEPQRELEAEGVRLARERRKEMRQLIETDPQRAWENRVSWRERQRLPTAVQAELETVVSGAGQLEVFAATPLPGQTNGFRPAMRVGTIGGERYEAFVYGRRANQPTRADVSLHGVAIDNVIALSDSPVRVLEADEPPSPTKVLAAAECPISGSDTAAVRAESGTRVYQLCSTEHVEALAEMVWQQEALAITSASSTGALSALVLIVDFPDLPGGNTTASNALEVMQQADLFYRSNSFGALSIGPVDVTPVMRLANESDYYLQGHSALMEDAIRLARGLGYVASEYRFVMVTFANIGFPWSGLGSVGASDSYVQGTTFRLRTVQHELGHNLGVWHAGAWLTADESVIGPGQHIELGNEFDIMGSGPGHMNGAFKAVLGWLPEVNIATAWADGVYRIHALDLGGELALDKAYTLRIPASPPLHGLPSDYWIDYRQQFTEHGASSGALLHWATDTAGPDHSHLLDMNPAGVYGLRDAALLVGRMFVDNIRRICVTPIAKGSTWLDIAVKFRPTNASVPTLSLNASALQVNPGQPVQFTATASDADGDTLAYYWDVDDGTVLAASLNQPSVTKTWMSPREYSVRCVVSDMKGGEASASVLVRVGNPITYHVAGNVASIPGVRVHNGLTGPDYRATYTDNEGRFVLGGLRAGSYVIGAAKSGNSFKPLFDNPVAVGPESVDDLQFGRYPPGALWLTRFSPVSGTIGTEVVIQGVNFQNVTSVKFGTLSALFTKEGPERVRAWVPSGAVSAPIVVAGAAGMDSSHVPFDVVPTPPVITQHPLSQTNGYTLNAYFTAAASGSGPFAYQWLKDGIDIPGATNTNFAIVNLISDDAGFYEFVARNSAGAVTSAPARMVLETRPTFADMLDTPELTWFTGSAKPWLTQSNITFDGIDAAESGVPEPTREERWLQTTVTLAESNLMSFWSRRADLLELLSIEGTNSRVLWSSLFPFNSWTQGSLLLDAGQHTLRFRTFASRVWLDQVSFMTGSPPVITRHPEDVSVRLDRDATLSVEASGAPPPRFQWYRWIGDQNTQLIPGATNSSFTIFDVHSYVSHYPYFVIVTNGFGSATGSMARVFALLPPSVIILSPESDTEVAAADFTVRVRASGPFPIQSAELFFGPDKIAEASAPGPDGDYLLRITNAAPSRNVDLLARATDSDGVMGSSDITSISLVLPLVTNRSPWKYLDGGRCPGPGWFLRTYNDDGWSNGVAPFGLGDYLPENEGTRVAFGVTTFYRHNFLVSDPGATSNIVVRLRCLGGAIVYLNGQELFRRNLPEGAIDFLTPGTFANPDPPFKYRLDPSRLAQGENLLAVEVHAPVSPDPRLLFDLAVVADLAPAPPEIVITSPRYWELITNSSFAITAEAFDVDSQIQHVRFFMDGYEIAQDWAPPWSAVISNLPPAGSPPWNYQSWSYFEVVATDAGGDEGRWSVTIANQPLPGMIDLVQRRSDWFYWYGDSSGPGPGWQTDPWLYPPTYWYEGTAPLGSWDGTAAWFRADFYVPGERHTNLVLYLFGELSEGAIVYVNGTEVFRHNLPPGPVASDHYTGLPQDFYGYVRHAVDPAALRDGRNIIAVQMHHNDENRARFAFDLALLGMLEQNPVGLKIEPAGPGPLLRLSWDQIYWYAARLEETDRLDEPWRPSEITAWQPFAVGPGTQKFFRLRWTWIQIPD